MTDDLLTESERTRKESSIPDLGRHIPALDGLRGMAIVMVLVCHFLPYRDQPNSLLGRLFFFLGRCGWSGVDLFFVLSGFLITGILLDAKGSRRYFRNFYARRTLRIFPLYYLVLAIVFLVVPWVYKGAFAEAALADIRKQQLWVWLYGTNLYMAWHKDMSFFYAGWLNLNPFWSLAVEEHFYLVWPAVVYFCRRAHLRWVCIGCVLGSLMLRALMIWKGGDEVWASIYVFTPCRADALAAGGLLAILLREDSNWVRPALPRAKWAALALGSVWVSSLWLNPERDDLWSLTLGYSLATGFFVALLSAVLESSNENWLRKPFEHAALRGLGKYSYGIYVYHVVLATSFDRLFGVDQLTRMFRARLHFGRAGYGVAVLSFIVLASAASFVIAFASWHLFEKRFLRLKRYFEYEARTG